MPNQQTKILKYEATCADRACGARLPAGYEARSYTTKDGKKELFYCNGQHKNPDYAKNQQMLDKAHFLPNQPQPQFSTSQNLKETIKIVCEEFGIDANNRLALADYSPIIAELMRENYGIYQTQTIQKNKERNIQSINR